jgi:hypothetical protein
MNQPDTVIPAQAGIYLAHGKPPRSPPSRGRHQRLVQKQPLLAVVYNPFTTPEIAMKYLLFCCTEEKKLNAMPKSEVDALMDETLTYIEALRKSGHYIASERLQPVETATMVRVRSGKLSTTDGPFAETKEQLGGFWLIDARDLNEAIQVASKFPSARLESIEVRPVANCDQQP